MDAATGQDDAAERNVDTENEREHDASSVMPQRTVWPQTSDEEDTALLPH